MDSQIVAIFCVCDDILKGIHHHEDKQCKMSDAEVMTTCITVAIFFSGNMETARTFLKEQGYIPRMLEKSRFTRRQHRIAELFLTPGSWSDTQALKMYQFDLPDEALITGDKAYNNYTLEDMMLEADLNLLPLRKDNSHRSLPVWLTYLLSYCRRVIETTGSLIERLLPTHIHAVTARGFELKVDLFVLAASFNLY